MRHMLKSASVNEGFAYSNEQDVGSDYFDQRNAPRSIGPSGRQGGAESVMEKAQEDALFGLDGQRDIQHVPFDYLIRVRDRYLSECFDIENGRRSFIDPKQAEDRLQHLRSRIDEIHEELARRDLAQRETDEEKWLLDELNREPAHSASKANVELDILSVEAVSIYTSDYMDGCLKRMEFLSDLAESARRKGELEMAAKYMMHVHELDRDRMEMLARMSGFTANGGRR